MHTDLNVTGRPAQFGRGLLNDVAVRLINQFAQCLEARMAPVLAGSATIGLVTTPQPQAADAIDLVSTAGFPVLKRLAPSTIGLIALLFLLRLAWRCGRRAGRKV